VTTPKFRVKIRGRGGAGDRELELIKEDFATLRQLAGGTAEIKHIERYFRRLQARGLAAHTFRSDDAGFPHAFGVLTADGEQALAQDPFATAAAR
jgi:hypothetical protein